MNYLAQPSSKACVDITVLPPSGSATGNNTPQNCSIVEQDYEPQPIAIFSREFEKQDGADAGG